MARDMQLAGDRVQTEYYLQFADHYFRVLNESRTRFDEQRRQRGDDSSDEDEDQDETVNASADNDREERDERPARSPRGGRDQRGDGGEERSEEHTSELQSLMRISYAVFCLKKKKNVQQE